MREGQIVKIEANQWYRTRGGEIAYVAGIVPCSKLTNPVVGGTHYVTCDWTLKGYRYNSEANTTDLVEHLPDCDSFEWQPKPTIQLEVGKKYVLANGDVVGPMNLDAVILSEYRYFSAAMRWNIFGIPAFPEYRQTRNIVSEYVEPKPTYEPWDFDSMPEFVRVKCKVDGKRCTAWPLSETLCQRGTQWFEYKDLFDLYIQLDGTPCGRIKS